MVRVQNFPNPEFRKSEFKTCCMLQNIKNSEFNGQIPLDKLKLNQKSYYYLRIQYFEADFLNQPQNPEFRNNPENFHPCQCTVNSEVFIFAKFRKNKNLAKW